MCVAGGGEGLQGVDLEVCNLVYQFIFVFSHKILFYLTVSHD